MESPLSVGARRADKSLIRSVVEWGHITGAALIVVAATLIGLFAFDLWIYQPEVDRTIEATALTRLGHEAMLDQQVGLRGFLASGDEQFLETYQSGNDALPELNREAERLIAGRGDLGGYLLEMRLTQQAWIDGWATEALARRRSENPRSASFLLLDETLFDEYRARYEILISHLSDHRSQAIADQRRALLIATALALLVTATAGVVGGRRVRALRRDVGIPLTALIYRLEEIRSGDFAPKPMPEGPSEFRTLHVGLEEAAASLAESAREGIGHTERLAARERRQAEVLAFTRNVSGNLSLPYVMRGVCTHASAIADGSRTIVWMMDPARSNLEPYRDSSTPDQHPIGVEPTLVGDGLVGGVGAFGRTQRRTEEAPDTGGRLAVPMVVSARVIGVLEFIGPQVPALTEEAVEVLETMATHAASAIGAARAYEATSEMAMTDALTGLRNRWRLNADLREECAAGTRYGRPLAVLMADIDHFKAYNDDFGHPAGDYALKGVAETLAEGLRNTDHAYRYGGEEFAVVLRETSSADAATFAERLRSAVERRFGGTDELRPVTISIGAASMPDHGSTPDSLVAAADDALYKAKKSGRNRTVSAPTPLTLAPDEPRQLGADVEEA